jgi:hypothetical protein
MTLLRLDQWSSFDLPLEIVKARYIKPGVDVMITIFGDFRQFSAKKLAFFCKTQFYDQNFAVF